MEEQNEQQQQMIKLDGSLGLTDRTIMTIITKDDTQGELEETFEIPSVLLDETKLLATYNLRLIKGFKLVRKEKRVEVDNF